MRWLFQYDVFISYSSVDRPWVEELAGDLIREGFHVFYDRWSIHPGQPWRLQLETAIQQSAAGVVVLSPDSVASGAVDAEVTALLGQAWQRSRPLIPVLYRTCQVPALLATRQYIDFRDLRPEARAIALNQLVRGLNGEPPGPQGALPRVRFWQRPFSIRLVLLMVLTLFLVVLPGIAITSGIRSKNTLKRIRYTQRDVQQIENRVNRLPRPTPSTQDRGEHPYFDPDYGEHIATDIWINGRLVRRVYYKGGRLAASDEFRYDQAAIIEKSRRYFDDSRQVFLLDRFTQDGVLIEKRHCPSGLQGPCYEYTDVMRSPLPPPGAVFYR